MFYDFINFAQGSTFGMNLYCFLLYCFLLLISLKGNVTNLYMQENNKSRTTLLFCGLLLFALTSFVGADFFHYYDFMNEYRGQVFGDQETGLEAFYQYLISYIDGNYFLFRLVIWGGSLIFITRTVRMFGVSLYHTLFLILAGFIITFSYARATLAMAVFSLGVVLVSLASEEKIKTRMFHTILGFAIMACSLYFHRSMLAVLALSFCWLFMPWKKQMTRFSLLLFPILVVICSFIMRTAFEELFVVANAVDDESGTLTRAEYYAEQEMEVSNVNGLIRLAFHYAAFYVPFIIIGATTSSKSIVEQMSKRSIWLYQIMFLIIIFATSFLFMEADMRTLHDRYLYMSFIPMTMLIAYMKDSGLLKRERYLWIVVTFVLSNLLQLFADVYSKA